MGYQAIVNLNRDEISVLARQLNPNADVERSLLEFGQRIAEGVAYFAPGQCDEVRVMSMYDGQTSAYVEGNPLLSSAISEIVSVSIDALRNQPEYWVIPAEGLSQAEMARLAVLRDQIEQGHYADDRRSAW